MYTSGVAEEPPYRIPAPIPGQRPTPAPLLSYLNGLPFAQDKHVQHIHVWILLEDVGLGMMLEVAMVPPVGGGALWGERRVRNVVCQGT